MFEQQLKTIYRGTCGVGVLPLRNSLDTAWPCQGRQTELQDRGCLCVCPPFTKEQHLGVTGTTTPQIHPQKTGLAFKVSLPSQSPVSKQQWKPLPVHVGLTQTIISSWSQGNQSWPPPRWVIPTARTTGAFLVDKTTSWGTVRCRPSLPWSCCHGHPSPWAAERVETPQGCHVLGLSPQGRANSSRLHLTTSPAAKICSCASAVRHLIGDRELQ